MITWQPRMCDSCKACPATLYDEYRHVCNGYIWANPHQTADCGYHCGDDDCCYGWNWYEDVGLIWALWTMRGAA